MTNTTNTTTTSKTSIKNWAIVADYDHGTWTRGDIISRHDTYELAAKALKRKGWDTFRSIQHVTDIERALAYDPVKLADAGFGDTGDLSPVAMTEREVRALAAGFVDHAHTLDELIEQIEACRM